MNNGFTYGDAERIINKAEEMPVTVNPDAQSVTQEIGVALQTFCTEEEMLSYLQDTLSSIQRMLCPGSSPARHLQS